MNIFFIAIVFLYLIFSLAIWVFLAKNSFKPRNSNTETTQLYKNKKLKSFLKAQIFLIVIFAISGVLYFFVGRFADLSLTEKVNAYSQKQEFDLAQKILVEKIEQNPANETAWFLLTQIAPKNENYDLGIKAYEQIIQMQGKNADFLANLAQLKYLQNGQKTNAQITQILDEALLLDAKNPLALTLAGMQEYQFQNWQKAKDYWSLALVQIKDDSLDAQILTSALKNVEAKLSKKFEQELKEKFAQLKVEVEIGANLQKRLKRHYLFDARVLVFIKVQGNSEPLEVVKLDATKLPTQVSLTYPTEQKNLEVFALLSGIKQNTNSYFATKKLTEKHRKSNEPIKLSIQKQAQD